MGRPVKPDSYAWTSPYGDFWVEHFYALHFHNLYGKKIVRENDLRHRLENWPHQPEIMLMGNFIVDRAGIVALCRAAGINVVHGEDGFFPHYSTMHADPLGFCWESSLPRMVFRKCSDRQRHHAQEVRAKGLAFQPRELPPTIMKPFVFWPLQLTGDMVNRWDLRVEDWTGLLRHFRQCLPKQYQLVLKEHPRSKLNDNRGVQELARELPNVVLVPRNTDLLTLLSECNAVAGANSTVLYEARLIFHKPAYVYARSWFTHHEELFFPVPLQHVRELSRFDFVEDSRLMRTERLNDYTDWFLAQLLARQINRSVAQENPEMFKQQVFRLSYHSFVEHGEEIFDNGVKMDEQVELKHRFVARPNGVHSQPVPKNRFWRADPQIPKVVHMLWVGSEPPKMVLDNVSNFRRLHPTWDLQFHRQLPADMPADMRDAAMKCPQFCQQADLARLWLLRQGGVWLDADVLAIRPFEELLHYDHFVSTHGATNNWCNHVMGFSPANPALAALLAAAAERYALAGPKMKRTLFGPALLADCARRRRADMHKAPGMWFSPIYAHATAVAFVKASEEERARTLEAMRHQFSDGVVPFVVSTWGIPAAEMPGRVRSSFAMSSGVPGGLIHGDPILRRLPPRKICGAEIGVLAGRLSIYLLNARPDLELILVDRWHAVPSDHPYAVSGDDNARRTEQEMEALYRQVVARTEFAGSRRRIIRAESVEAARQVADGSLDFVFIDADHSYEGCRADINTWIAKLRPSGLLCGHDLDNPHWPQWGVRRAVEETAARLQLPIETDACFTWFIRLRCA